ncbi:MAG: hypothetical protein IPN92_13540 [Chromatiaceae bacterium]|nr:hypothetical protein [Chromatiaceae bacterium]
MIKKDESVAEMKAQLDAWNTEIDTLQEKAHEIREDAKVKYEEQLVALRATRAAGELKLAEMQAATESNWAQVKAEAEHVWEAFKDSFNTFKSHYK